MYTENTKDIPTHTHESDLLQEESTRLNQQHRESTAKKAGTSQKHSRIKAYQMKSQSSSLQKPKAELK